MSAEPRTVSPASAPAAGPAPAGRASRSWHALLALVVVVAVVVQLVLVVRGVDVLVVDGRVASTPARVLRFFSYFTIQSNLLVAATAATLALDPGRDGTVWRVLRLDAVVGITVTGIIYVLLLRPVVDLHGVSGATDKVFHYVVPVMAVLGWLVWGPRPRVDEATVLRSLVWPALYVAYTLVHGALSHWYPYPFIDVERLGYVATLRNGVGVCLLLLGVALAVRQLDRVLATAATRRAGAH